MSEELFQHSLNENSRKNLPQEQNSNELLEFEELVEALPKEERKIFRELIFALQDRTSWQGLLPPPEVLKKYNEAVGDGAESIFRIAERKLVMAEKQAEHRMEIEKKAVARQQRQADWGMTFAFLICLTFIIISGIIILQGHDVAGTLLGTIDLIGLATVFILGKRYQNQYPA